MRLGIIGEGVSEETFANSMVDPKTEESYY